VSRAGDPPRTGGPAPPARADDVRVRIAVRGRVQGVWFRGAAREAADRLRLVGWARNLADGSVEILAQGNEQAIEQFVEWCHHGPPAARVASVATQREMVQDDLHGFRVRT
jgi:acylphosphatase